ncbi:MAG: iron-sulfur cluster assembly accessory protein [Hyphomicrobiaceae bacterium]|jgi:iron-sulfur cluster assembly accessory protein
MEQQHSERIVDLTESAVARVRAAMESDGRTDLALRLSVTKGGCSGYEYSIKFTDSPEEADIHYDIDDVAVFVASDSVEQLRGTLLDFDDGLYGAGLKFVNPNAAHSCGCGASFSTTAAAQSPESD